MTNFSPWCVTAIKKNSVWCVIGTCTPHPTLPPCIKGLKGVHRTIKFPADISYWQLYCTRQGFWYFTEKKAKFRRIFRGKFAEKSANFAGFSPERSQNSLKNRLISREKVKIRRKIGRFRGILAEKSQISKDFQGQILRKIGRFHGKFQGETSPRNNQ